MSANDSKPLSLFSLASHLESEAASLKTGLRLLLDELAIRHDNPEEVARAVSRLYFIGGALDSVAGRIEALSDGAYALAAFSRAAQPGQDVTVN